MPAVRSKKVVSCNRSAKRNSLEKGAIAQFERGLLPSPSIEENLRTLKTLLLRLVSEGESTSVIVTGPRGSGKTKVVETAISEVQYENNDIARNLTVVRLNGFLQTDDRIALQEIARQVRGHDEDMDFTDKATLSDHFHFLLSMVKSDRGGNRSAVFMLDELDLFAQHHNQTLLYTLLDASLMGRHPLLIIGLTTRLTDMIDLLEKRVKSRFSQRILCCFNDYPFETYYAYGQYLLTSSSFHNTNDSSEFNASVKRCFSDESIKESFRKVFDSNRSIEGLKRYIALVICSSTDDNQLTKLDFDSALKLMWSDSRACVLQDLPLIEVGLLIAAKHQMHIRDEETFNFEMIYSEYCKFVKRSIPVMNCNRSVMLKAFEHLIHIELITPIVSTINAAKSTLLEYRLMELQLNETDLIDAVGRMLQIPEALRNWVTVKPVAPV